MKANKGTGAVKSISYHSIKQKEIKKLSPLLGCLENFNELEQMPIEDEWKFSSSV